MELLAPGGSIEGMKGAFCAGADAVYMGGMRFGARAYADNPDSGALLDAIDFCHFHGKKLYLTVNTLLRDDEFSVLYQDMIPVYEHGVDAVLVQDFGVLSFLKREFPDLALHASTQMSVMSEDGAALLKKLGAERIVPARELSLEEIRRIRDRVDIEIECFIHGALCYSYSGQCLLSSLIGGRSGNRGRCAQPCRLPWTLEGAKKKDPFLLSLKDIQTLSLLPQIQEAGIVSLKIEGRMKQPEYAAGVTAVYRKYLDMLAQNGSEGFTVDPEDERVLMDLYNRGGFSTGYYFMPGGRSMLSGKRPNHAGTPAVKVKKGPRGRLTLTALEKLYPSDVIEILPSEPGRGKGQERPRQELVLQGQYNAGDTLPISRVSRYTDVLEDGKILPRTRCETLMREIRAKYLSQPQKSSVRVAFTAHAGCPALLTLSWEGAKKVSVTVCSGPVQKAEHAAATKEDISKQLRKMGDTPFSVRDLEIDMDEGLFLRVAELNALRRSAVKQLEEKIMRSFSRSLPDGAAYTIKTFRQENGDREENPVLSAAAETAGQALSLCEAEYLREICIDVSTLEPTRLKDVIGKIHSSGKRAILMLPPVWRVETADYYYQHIHKYSGKADGFLLRCTDQIGAFCGRFPEKTMIADAGIYSWNREAVSFLRELGFDRLTLPLEENASQLRRRGAEGEDLILYGYLPVMYSAQCVVRNTRGCKKIPSRQYIRDRMGTLFPVENRCSICTNIIYNSLPLDLTACMDDVRTLRAGAWRLVFTDETPETCLEITRKCEKILTAGPDAPDPQQPALCGVSTRGHFKRGAQ